RRWRRAGVHAPAEAPQGRDRPGEALDPQAVAAELALEVVRGAAEGEAGEEPEAGVEPAPGDPPVGGVGDLRPGARAGTWRGGDRAARRRGAGEGRGAGPGADHH